jgi:hypothetical protein
MSRHIKVATDGSIIEEESSVCGHSMTTNNPEAPDAPLDPDDDKVNNPSHYQSYIKDGIDCITAMQHAFGIEATATFCKLNAFKYNWRASSKNGNEDIQKAIWYLNKYLELGGESL